MNAFFDDPTPVLSDTTTASHHHHDTPLPPAFPFCNLLALLSEGMGCQSAQDVIAHHFQQKVIECHALRQKEAAIVDELRDTQEEELASLLKMGSRGDAKVLVSCHLMEPVFTRHNRELEKAVARSNAAVSRERLRCREELGTFLQMICEDLRDRGVVPTAPCPLAGKSPSAWFAQSSTLHGLRVPNPRRESLHGARTRDPSVAPIIVQLVHNSGGPTTSGIDSMLVRTLPLDAVVQHLLKLGHHRLSLYVLLDEAMGHSDDVWKGGQEDELLLEPAQQQQGGDSTNNDTFILGGTTVKMAVTTCLWGGNIVLSVPACPRSSRPMSEFVAALLNFSAVSGVEHLTLVAGPDPTLVLRSLVETVSVLLVDSTAQRTSNPWSTCSPAVLAGGLEGACGSPLAKGQTAFNLGFGITVLIEGGEDGEAVGDHIQATAQAAFPDGFELF